MDNVLKERQHQTVMQKRGQSSSLDQNPAGEMFFGVLEVNGVNMQLQMYICKCYVIFISINMDKNKEILTHLSLPQMEVQER